MLNVARNFNNNRIGTFYLSKLQSVIQKLPVGNLNHDWKMLSKVAFVDSPADNMIKKVQKGFRFTFEAEKFLNIQKTKHGIDMISQENKVIGVLNFGLN